MDFEKYQHVERYGTVETEGVEFGKCYIFPKIDGTNGSIWSDKGAIFSGSRKRQLSDEEDNAGFNKWVIDNIGTKWQLFLFHPELRLYGEWLVPHTLKTYEDSAWKNFYVFDVMEGDRYLTYEEYQPLMEKFGIDYIPPIAIIENPSYEKLIGFLDRNTFLIKDGQGFGEGIVIKNYSYRNRFGRQTWAKIVRNESKTKHQKNDPTVVNEKEMVEQEIVNRYVTSSLVDKEYSKITSDDGWQSKFIPRLLNTVYYCLVKEESWNFVKEFKNPIIDYRRLNFITIAKVKELKPELF